MDDCDEAWENFCDGGSCFLEKEEEKEEENDEEDEKTEVKVTSDDKSHHNENQPTIVSNRSFCTPTSTDIYISTQTKIIYLNKTIDLQKSFWEIPIITYSDAKKGVVKKQMKLNFVTDTEITHLHELLEKEGVVEEHIITRLLNNDGLIKKDIRKISVGICKKDIINYRCKQKSAFYNCFVLIIRISIKDVFKECHVKIFNTGKVELPGIQSESSFLTCIDDVIEILNTHCHLDVALRQIPFETVLINSNFSCGYFIDRDKLYDILKLKYNFHTSYDPCSYPGIMSKFYYDSSKKTQDGIKKVSHGTKQVIEGDTGDDEIVYKADISFMIFRTGSVLIVGKCDENILMIIYDFLKTLLKNEYMNIRQVSNSNTDIKYSTTKSTPKKVRKKIISFIDH